MDQSGRSASRPSCSPRRMRAASFVYSTTVSLANSPNAPTPPGIVSNPFNIGNGNTLTFIGGSSVVAVDESGPLGADINFGSIKFTPAANNNDPTPFDINYNFQVTITDQTTNGTQILNFTGNLSGNASGLGGNGASITSTVASNGVSPTMLDFGGGNIYYISDKGGVGPGSSNSVISDGALQGNLRSMPSVPEPSSAALMAIGGLAFGIVARRRMAKRSEA